MPRARKAIVGLPALVFVVLRALGFIGGARLAARIAGAPESVRRWLGFGLLPQAGLALALSLLLARTFPQFGEEAGMMALGVVALNELVAPVLYRWALVRSGETGRLESASGAHHAVEPRPAGLSADDSLTTELGRAAIASAWASTSSAPVTDRGRVDTGSWPQVPDATNEGAVRAPVMPALPTMPSPRRATQPTLPDTTSAPADPSVGTPPIERSGIRNKLA